MKKKRIHKRKHKRETRSLLEWREVRNLARYNRRISEMIKAFREQAISLANMNPF